MTSSTRPSRALDETRAAAQQALAADERYRPRWPRPRRRTASPILPRKKRKPRTRTVPRRASRTRPTRCSRIYGRAASVRRPMWAAVCRARSTAGSRASRTSSRLRRDYWLLTELPARFDEHAKRMRVEGRRRSRGRARARARRGRGGRRCRSARKRSRRPPRRSRPSTRRVDEHEAALDALVEKRAAFAAGDDELSRRANEVVRDALRGETMRSLRERATATPTPDDDAAVDQLTVVRADLPRIDGGDQAPARAARDAARPHREARGDPQALQGEPLRRRVVGVRERRVDRRAADAAPCRRARRRRHLGRAEEAAAPQAARRPALRQRQVPARRRIPGVAAAGVAAAGAAAVASAAGRGAAASAAAGSARAAASAAAAAFKTGGGF